VGQEDPREGPRLRPWHDPQGALAKYNAQKEDLRAGRKPREEAPEGVTVKLVANAFLTHKKALLTAGELSQRTWLNYEETAEMVIRQFGSNRLAAYLGPDDFAKLRDHMTNTKKWGPVRVPSRYPRNSNGTRGLLQSSRQTPCAVA
jgi:hypothetical protein